MEKRKKKKKFFFNFLYLFDRLAYASQGTPPSSPAAASIFSRVMGATTANKQGQGSGNPLGIAAVLLQGAQGKIRVSQ